MRIFLTIIFFIYACGGSEYSCGKIDRKFEKNGEYFFALIFSDASNNEEGRVYGDVSVSKTVYQLKNIGEEYCVEE